MNRLEEIVHLAFLTNHELCVYIWIQIFSSLPDDEEHFHLDTSQCYKNDLNVPKQSHDVITCASESGITKTYIKNWLLNSKDSDGPKCFLKVALDVAALKFQLMPSKIQIFKRKDEDSDENHILLQLLFFKQESSTHVDEDSHITPRTQSQLITETANKLPHELFTFRLFHAVQMLEEEALHQTMDNKYNTTSATTTSNYMTPISLAQMARLLHASTYSPTNPQLQHRILSILWRQFHSFQNSPLMTNIPTQKDDLYSNMLRTMMSIQYPILERLDPYVWKERNIPTHSNPNQPWMNVLQMLSQHDDNIDNDVNNNHNHIPITDQRTFELWKIYGLIHAANLARRGNQIGSKHGCVIIVSKNTLDKHDSKDMTEYTSTMESNHDIHSHSLHPSYAIVGQGWNHNILLNKKGGKKRMVHAEVHAVADTIRAFGESFAIRHIFPKALVVIVELKGEASYDNAPPCPKCQLLLRAVGVHKSCYSTDHGLMEDMDLPSCPVGSNFFENPIVHVPLRSVCDEMGIVCSKIEDRGLDGINVSGII